MDLKKLFDERKQTDLTAWVSFEGFDLELIHTDAFAISRMLERSKRTEWKRHQPVETYDDDRFAELLAERVKGWRKLTLGVLETLVALDITGQDPETPVDFSRENLLFLMKNVAGLANFIRQSMMEISNFRRIKQAEEVKN